jgi:hypothetical protein
MLARRFGRRQDEDVSSAMFLSSSGLGSSREFAFGVRQLLAANSETAVILEQRMLGIAVLAAALVLLPFLLVMAGVGAAMLLWFAACGALLGALVFWLVFPGTYALAVLLFVLVIGLVVVDRRSWNRAS